MLATRHLIVIYVGKNFAIVGHVVITLTVTKDLKVLHVRACLVFDLIQREICKLDNITFYMYVCMQHHFKW